MSATGEAPLILVVDDDDLVREWIGEVLRGAGYRVAEAEDGVQGLAIAQEQSPALMVLDMFMNGKEGLETILELRKAGGVTTVLAISGGPIVGYDALRAATAFGAKAVLAKPFSAETLLEQVRELTQSATGIRLQATVSLDEAARE